MHTKLSVDVARVVVDRAGGNVELLLDSRSRVPTRQQLENVNLTVRELEFLCNFPTAALEEQLVLLESYTICRGSNTDLFGAYPGNGTIRTS